jgi:hypothetical protein
MFSSIHVFDHIFEMAYAGVAVGMELQRQHVHAPGQGVP